MSNRAVSSGDRSGHGQNTKREDEQPGIGPRPTAEAGGARGHGEIRPAPGCGRTGQGRVATRPPGRGTAQKRLAGVHGKHVPTRTVPFRATTDPVGGTSRDHGAPEVLVHHSEKTRHGPDRFLGRGTGFLRRTDVERAPGTPVLHPGRTRRNPGTPASTPGRRRRGRATPGNTDGLNPGLCLSVRSPLPAGSLAGLREDRGNRFDTRPPGCGRRPNRWNGGAGPSRGREFRENRNGEVRIPRPRGGSGHGTAGQGPGTDREDHRTGHAHGCKTPGWRRSARSPNLRGTRGIAGPACFPGHRTGGRDTTGTKR